MGTRVRKSSSRLYELFAKIEHSSGNSTHKISFMYPADFADNETIGSLSKFSFPVGTDFESQCVDHFTFVLTDIEGKFRFGFCRLSTDSKICLCMLSYHPWHEVFFKLLNMLAEAMNDTDGITSILKQLSDLTVAKPGTHISTIINDKELKIDCPEENKLPCIPENRNLMEYYSAVDTDNMMDLFASMLVERRIIVTSRRLSRLTACIHAASALLYPLHWQQIYIPALPPHLLDYCTAPMPYIIGVHSSLLTATLKAELDDAVILDADNNRLTQKYDDRTLLPRKVISALSKQLRQQDSYGKPSPLWGDAVSKAFLAAMVSLIGNYHKAFKHVKGKLEFDDDVYTSNRPPKFQPIASFLLSSQAFRQFIDERLDRINREISILDTFETALNVAIVEGAVDRKKKKTKEVLKVTTEHSMRSLAKIARKMKGKSKKPAECTDYGTDPHQSAAELHFDANFKPVNRKRSGTVPIVSPARLSVHARLDDEISETGSSLGEQPSASSFGSDGKPSVTSLQRTSLSHANNGSLPLLRHRSILRSVSKRDSDLMADSILSPRISLLNDPDLQHVLKKSLSAEALCESITTMTTTTLSARQSVESDSSCDLLDDIRDDNVFDDCYFKNFPKSATLDSRRPLHDLQVQNGGSSDEIKRFRSPTGGKIVAQIIEKINNNNAACSKLPGSSELSKKRPTNSLSESRQVSRVKAIVESIEAAKTPVKHDLSKAPVPSRSPLPAAVAAAATTGQVLPKDCRSVEERRRELMQSAHRKPVQRNRTIMRASGFPRLQPVSARKEVLLKRVAGPEKSSDSESSPELSPTHNKPFTSNARREAEPVLGVDKAINVRDTSLESEISGTWTVLPGPQSVLVKTFSTEEMLDDSQSSVITAPDDVTALNMRLSQSLDMLKSDFVGDQNSLN